MKLWQYSLSMTDTDTETRESIDILLYRYLYGTENIFELRKKYLVNILGTRKIFWLLGKYFYLLRTLRYWKPPSWPPSSEPAWEWSEGVAAVTWRLAAGGAGAGAVPGRDTRLGHSLLS